ncbi:MAG: crossover junction endodeoxyribonuclease RuvC [Saprospiraceae bacterium]|jgi:crossover junction endodeoxyribonuclease RuvC
MSKSKRILGVDPGTNFLGYAVIQVEKNKIQLVKIGVVKMGHLETQQLKLKKIFERLQEIISSSSPDSMAIEAPFFGKNVQSMLKLGRAQGVAIAAGMTKEIDVTEYSPKKIKQSVTGNGNASKEQVAAMLETILKTKLDDQTLDATDALATAVCHHFQSSNVLSGGKKHSGWDSFAKDNPDRVKK